MNAKSIFYLFLVIFMYVFLFVLALVVVGVLAQRLKLDRWFTSDRQLNLFIFVVAASLYVVVILLFFIDWARLMLESAGWI